MHRHGIGFNHDVSGGALPMYRNLNIYQKNQGRITPSIA
jgi:hypothetical protein